MWWAWSQGKEGKDFRKTVQAAADAGIETWWWPRARLIHHEAHTARRKFEGEPFDLLLVSGDPHQLGEYVPRVVEAERLIEIRRDQKMPRDRHVLPAFACP